VGPGDDCAVVAGDGIALSADLSVEKVHFRRDWLTFGEIGARAAAAALSDLAAIAARPIGVLVSLAMPPEDAEAHAAELMDGVRRAAEAVGGALLGGDLARSPGPVVVDVTVVGECPRPVLRSGAHAGHEVWVTGELGGSAAYVAARLAGDEGDPEARERFAAPRPRVREALWLAERNLPTAMIDLSDGLAGDAAHLSAASSVAVLLIPELIPVHPAARRRAGSDEEALRMALSGGEDYELCFTAPVGAVTPYLREFETAFGVPLTSVGRLGGGDGVWWVDAEGHRRPLGVHGYRHFEEGEG
jgi:thiamine-monophosphate kinase